MRPDNTGIEFDRADRGRPWTTGEPGQPCASCGVRPDVACQHRPASGGLPIALREDDQPKDGRKTARGQGRNFGRKGGK